MSGAAHLVSRNCLLPSRPGSHRQLQDISDLSSALLTVSFSQVFSCGKAV
jgi:hypothetical protein